MQEFTVPDFIGILCSSHRQIERSLAPLIRIANESHDGPLCEPAAFSRALQFFRVVVPDHSAAEEETLFPRLRRALPSDRKDVRRLIDTLEEEHGCAGRAHEEVDRLGELWLANGQLSSVQATRLTAILEGLAGLYDRHIQLEEKGIFPLLAVFCTPTDLAMLGTQLARRQASAPESITR